MSRILLDFEPIEQGSIMEMLQQLTGDWTANGVSDLINGAASEPVSPR